MKRQQLSKLAAVIGTFALTLSTYAFSGDSQVKKITEESNQVPTSGEAWFKAGNQEK